MITTDKGNLQSALELLREAAPQCENDTEETINDFIAQMEQPVVKVLRDLDPSNPFEESDCEVPLAVAHLSNARYSMSCYGVEDRLPHIPGEVVERLQPEMLAFLGYHGTLDEMVRMLHADVGEDRDTFIAIVEALAEDYAGHDAEDRLKMLDQVYTWLDIPHVLGSTTGYVQGAYAHVLAVATPEWVKEVGLAPDETHPKEERLAYIDMNLKNAIQLYGWWAWGDTWGYTVETRAGEEIEGGWGFYGTTLDETGMLDNVDKEYHDLLKEAWEKRFES